MINKIHFLNRIMNPLPWTKKKSNFKKHLTKWRKNIKTKKNHPNWEENISLDLK